MRKLWPLLLLLAACGTQDPTGVGVEPLRLTATSLPPAYLGENYAYAFSAEGGVQFYAWSLHFQQACEHFHFLEALAQDLRLFGAANERVLQFIDALAYWRISSSSIR
jgi:hypothetical protein